MGTGQESGQDTTGLGRGRELDGAAGMHGTVLRTGPTGGAETPSGLRSKVLEIARPKDPALDT